jgi:hypothetical protein
MDKVKIRMENELNVSIVPQQIDAVKKQVRPRQRRTFTKNKKDEVENFQADVPERFSTEPSDAELSYSYRDETPPLREEWHPSSTVVVSEASVAAPSVTTVDGVREYSARGDNRCRNNNRHNSQNQRRDNRPQN